MSRAYYLGVLEALARSCVGKTVSALAVNSKSTYWELRFTDGTAAFFERAPGIDGGVIIIMVPGAPSTLRPIGGSEPRTPSSQRWPERMWRRLSTLPRRIFEAVRREFYESSIVDLPSLWFPIHQHTLCGRRRLTLPGLAKSPVQGDGAGSSRDPEHPTATVKEAAR